MTQKLAADEAGIGAAAGILRRGGLVAFPTETVYGLGADATSGEAVARIYEAKGRPSFNPLIVHVAEADAAWRYGKPGAMARALAEAFWPGPLTLVLPVAGGGVSPLVTAGLGSVALRVPGGDLSRRLLSAAGVPLAAPSANPSGRVSATTADHVVAGLWDRIDAVIDGGPCVVGVESTIVGLDGPAPRLLRAGGVPVEEIEAVIGRPLEAAGEGVSAPGMMASHYAPTGVMRLGVTVPEAGEVMVGFGDVAGDVSLSEGGDLREAAARLFGVLQDLDRAGAARIAVAPVPRHGLGLAINDRLRRASAPRG